MTLDMVAWLLSPLAEDTMFFDGRDSKLSIRIPKLITMNYLMVE